MSQIRLGTDETAEFSERLENELAARALEKSTDVEAICSGLNAGLQAAMTSTLSPVQRSSTAPPWESAELAGLLSKLKSVTGYVARRRATRQIKRMKAKLKGAYFARLASEINFAREQRAVEREFRLSKQFGYGSQSRATYVTPDQFAAHFEAHFRSEPHLEIDILPEISSPELFPHLQDPVLEIGESALSRDELSEVLKGLNNGRSWGVDAIPMELLKYNMSPAFLDALVNFFGEIWKQLTIPAEWTTSSIVTLFKKGAQSLLSNYRGLSITSNLARLLPMIILHRLRKVYESSIDPLQFGFRRDRSTCDAIFVLNQMLRSLDCPLVVNYIDLTAAFDKIPRSLLFAVLRMRTGSKFLIDLLQLLYTTSLYDGHDRRV